MNTNEYKNGKIAFATWLDSRTVAILGMILAGTVGLGTMMGQMRTDMNQMRQQLRADIAKLDDRLRAVEIDVTAIRTGMKGFDARLGAVERHARHLATATPDHPES